jgi:hypothetical protein
MQTAQTLSLYNIAFRYFKNEADATAFVTEIENAVNEKVLAKGDLFEKIVTNDIASLKQEMQRTFATKQDLAEVKTDMIKWMFIFWATSIVSTLGGLVLVVKFMVTK